MDDALAHRDTLVADLEGRSDPRLVPFIAALTGIDTAASRPPRARLDHPAMAHLDTALAEADDAVRKAARALDWSQVFAGGGIDPALAGGMLAAQLAGSYGRFPSDTMATGLFLLAPGIAYPLHTHAAQEIYVCHAGRLTLQHGLEGAPFVLAPGQVSITPSNRLHALTVGETPVLLSYVWIGDLAGPNWWWAQDAAGEWQRTAWQRIPGEPWKPVRSQPVSAATMAEAHR